VTCDSTDWWPPKPNFHATGRHHDVPPAREGHSVSAVFAKVAPAGRQGK
jgi:hypothetical protein